MVRPISQSFLRHPLSAIFANPANVRVLRELSKHGGELAPATLTERTKLSKPTVLAALDYLATLGFVEPLGSVPQRLYRIDGRHPLVPALSAVFAAEDHRFQSILGAIKQAAIDAGVTAAWLYGSVARGEDRSDSDVDVVLVASGDAGTAKAKVREALRDREDEQHFSASVLGFSLDEIRHLAAERDPWWTNMVKDAVPLVGPGPGTLASSRAAEKLGAA